jgi:hypothetical protein
MRAIMSSTSSPSVGRGNRTASSMPAALSVGASTRAPVAFPRAPPPCRKVPAAAAVGAGLSLRATIRGGAVSMKARKSSLAVWRKFVDPLAERVVLGPRRDEVRGLARHSTNRPTAATPVSGIAATPSRRSRGIRRRTRRPPTVQGCRRRSACPWRRSSNCPERTGTAWCGRH